MVRPNHSERIWKYNTRGFTTRSQMRYTRFLLYDNYSVLIETMQNVKYLALDCDLPDNGKAQSIRSRVETTQLIAQQSRQHRHHLVPHKTPPLYIQTLFLLQLPNAAVRLIVNTTGMSSTTHPLHKINTGRS